MATLFDHDKVSERVSDDPLVVVALAGEPQGKGRPRFRVVQPRGKPSFVSVYTPAETVAYENALRDQAWRAMAGRPPLDGPLSVRVFAYVTIPKSWSQKKRAAALAGEIRPTGKPDWENVAKMLDAFNPYKDPRTKLKIPVLWADDAKVVHGEVIQLYATKNPGLVVEVRRAGPPPARWFVVPGDSGITHTGVDATRRTD